MTLLAETQLRVNVSLEFCYYNSNLLRNITNISIYYFNTIRWPLQLPATDVGASGSAELPSSWRQGQRTMGVGGGASLPLALLP